MGLIDITKNFINKFINKAATKKNVKPLINDRDILSENANEKLDIEQKETIIKDSTLKTQYKPDKNEQIINSSIGWSNNIKEDFKINKDYNIANINYSKDDNLSKWQEHLDIQLAYLKNEEDRLKNYNDIDDRSVDEKLKNLKKETAENTFEYKHSKNNELIKKTTKQLDSISKFINSINLVARYKERKANSAVLKENYIIDINKKLKNLSNSININLLEAKVEYNRIFEIINNYNPKLQRIYKDAIQENKAKWNTTLRSVIQRITQRENEIAQEQYKNIIVGKFEALERLIPTNISIAIEEYNRLLNIIELNDSLIDKNEHIVISANKVLWNRRLFEAQEKIKQRQEDIVREKYENDIQNLFNSLEKALSTEKILEVRSIRQELSEKLTSNYKAWKQKLAELIEKEKVLDQTLLKKADKKIKEETYALEQILALKNTSEINSINDRIKKGIQEIKNTYPQLEARFDEVKSKLKYLIALKAEEDKQAYIAKIDGLFDNLKQAFDSESVYDIRSYIQSIQKNIDVDYKNWNSKLSDAKSILAAIERRIREEKEAREIERLKQQYIEEIEGEFSNLEYYINNEYTDDATTIINRLSYKIREDYNDFTWRLQQARNQVRAIEREKEQREREEKEQREKKSRASLDSPSKKSNWTEFRDVLQANGISRFYHFTARENIAKIKASGGLYSWYYLENNGKSIPIPGGGEESRRLDKQHGLQDYVRLSFTKSHPMAYSKLKAKGIPYVVLEIDIEVAYFEETRFSDMNAAANDHQQGKSIYDLKRVNFAATQKRYVRSSDPDFPYLQAEVMVKTHIPLKYIKNI